MKQLIQHLKTGETIIEEVPSPALPPGYVLIRTVKSLISTGTEKMLVEFSKASLITKARQNPERVAQVLDKIKTDGLFPTIEAVFRRLDEPLPLGYCNVGTIVEIGDGVTEFKIGDRVASNGVHAEFVAVPKNLVALIPETVSDEMATFTVVSSIGLQAIRIAKPEFGDSVVVIGLGLIGLLTCQLAISNGCKVIAFDIDDDKINIARKLNIDAYHSENDDIIGIVNRTTNNSGADIVLIAASAKNDDIINTSARIARKLGKIVLIGVINLNIDRSEFYKKEIHFQVSCSYGPGRYDESYEQKGIDYPYAYVRWTVKRNFETVLQCMLNGSLQTELLISNSVPFSDAPKVYSNISSNKAIATILNYSEEITPARQFNLNNTSITTNKPTVAIIGAGNYTKLTLLPALEHSGFTIKYIASNDGLNAALLAKKYKIHNAVTDNNIIFNDKDVDLVIIATRHDSHALLTAQALANKKHVFVEKPLALNVQDLEKIATNYAANKISLLFVGFNRRHAPLSIKAKSLLPKNMVMNINITVNAGALLPNHWLFDETIGGGRIIGEACHFFDLMCYFTGSSIKTVYASSASASNNIENVIAHLTFSNGSHGTISYFANGNKSFPKETISIFCNNQILVIDNFKKLSGFGFPNFKSKTTKQDKGHSNQFKTITSILEKGGNAFTSFDELYNTTNATFAAIESIKQNQVITI